MMQAEHIQLVQSTIPVLREHGVALTQHFYQRMLSNHPELKNVFNMDHQQSGRQPRALAAAVLAYAEHIEHPEKLAKAIQHIATKHVSLGIQPEQYAIVGDNLLHSISEVLNVAMDSALIAAWEAAYGQLADILIQTEQAQYAQLKATAGGWAGWRDFKIVAQAQRPNALVLYLQALDELSIAAAQQGQSIALRVDLTEQHFKQPQHYGLQAHDTPAQYCIWVTNDAADCVSQQLRHAATQNLLLNTAVQLSAPIAANNTV